MLIIPALGRLRQEDHEFKTSLDFIVTFRPAWATSKNKPGMLHIPIIPSSWEMKAGGSQI
jgi:hypothetical protein